MTGFSGGGGGVLIGRGHAEITSYQSTTTAIPTDDTIPQSGEGKEAGTLSYTAQDALNILRVTVTASQINASAAVGLVLALFIDGEASARRTAIVYTYGGNYQYSMSFQYEMVAGSIAAQVFKVRFGSNSGTAYLNGSTAARSLGGSSALTITVEELRP